MVSDPPVASSSTSTSTSHLDSTASRISHSVPFPSATPAARPSSPSLSQLRARRTTSLQEDHTLDERSWEHVLDLLKQSLKGCKIKDEAAWLDPTMTSLRALVSTLDPTTLGAIVDSRIAEDRAQLAETRQRQEANPNNKDRARKGKDKESLPSALGVEGGEAEKGQRRERWRSAALLLMPSEESDIEDEEASRASLQRSNSLSAADVETEHEAAEGLGPDDSAWMSVAGAPKLTIFQVMLCSTETSLSAVRSGTSKLGVEFVRDQWHGKGLFGKSRCIDYEDEDLKLVARVGGTFYLIATAKELPKLERIIELVAFAAVSLRLEVGLLRDFRCPRPIAVPESTPSTPPPPPPPPTELSGEDTIHDDLDDEVPSIPGAYSSDTPPRRQSLRRSKWSRGSLWGILLGSQNRPKTVPLSRSRSMTVSVIPTRSTVIVPPTPPRLPSLELSSPTTSSTSLRIKNKVKGFSEGLLQRRSRGKPSDDASSPKTGSRKMPADSPLLEEVRSQSLDLGERRSWDILGGMSLGIFGAAKREEMLSPRPVPSPALTEGAETLNVDRFQRIINAMETCILSVSPDVVYPPPHLLVRLRQQELAQAPPVDLDAQSFDFGEAETPRRKSTLDRIMLDATPRQGTRGHLDSQALAMNLVTGNLNLARQDLTSGGGMRSASGSSLPTTATSHATRITLEARAGLQSLMTANMTLSGTFRHQGMQFLVETVRSDATSRTPPCKPPKWLAYDYYSDGSAHSDIDGDVSTRPADSTLGQILERLVRKKDEACESPTCKMLQRDHRLVLMHSKDRLKISLSDLNDDVLVEGKGAGTPEACDTGNLLAELNSLEQDPASLVPRIAAWTSCKICQASTEPSLLSAASYAFSFAKWTELLLYDPNFVPLPDLCSHATDEKGALVRSFAIDRTVIKMVMDQIELFELRLPTAVDADIDHIAPTQAELEQDVAPLELLKTEISSFYGSLRARLAILDERLQSNLAAATPSEAPSTLPEEPAEAITSDRERSNSEDTVFEHQADATESMSEASLDVEPAPPSTYDLFQNLRVLVDENEQECLRLAECLSAHQLNEGRYFFLGMAKSDKARVAAWEQKHAADLGGTPFEAPTYSEPDYLVNPTVHLFPVDSSVMVREDEPSSFIALTLSAKAFQEEVDTPVSVPSRKVTPDSVWGSFNSDLLPSTRKPSRQPIPAEFTSHIVAAAALDQGVKPSQDVRAAKALSKSPSRVGILDPDDPSADFAPVDEVEFKAKPKKVVRAGSVLQRLGRQRPLEPSAGTGSSLRPSPSPTPTPKQSFHKGCIFRSEPLSVDVLEDLLVTSGSMASTPPRAGVRRATPTIIAGLSVKKHAAEATTTSVVSYSSASSLSVPEGPEKSPGSPSTVDIPSRSLASLSSLDSAPSTRPSTPVPSRTPTEDTNGDENIAASLLSVPTRSQGQESTTSPKFLTNAFSTLLSLPDSLRGLGPSSKAANLVGISNSGHTKFSESSEMHRRALGACADLRSVVDFRHGDKSFRVTAWYAARFRALRARCGLSESLPSQRFVESLSRCSDLRPSGGKSSAGFWITGDRRFMLKELVTAWGVSEREAFLSFCPALLDYLMSPQVASLLAKIFGFYTVKVKNHATGEVRKLDLVCMEHLFHSTSITRTFDLKGVASRTAKVTTNDSSTTRKTGWDGDWLTQDRLLIYAHSKTLLREALSNDVKFLSDNGGVDYSLLVGVNDEKKELVIGLIDTLGVFNTLKLVEHQVKSGVKKATASDANQVTVLPPTDYATRFKSAMDAYFISVPDKFSKPPGDVEAMNTDPRLASVL
ncbi:BQ2448_3799 [Microbotryum intermedium]|uniref:BQ2448_3799 protein n=1 Tax=Microbotryum intermedium TaxID=269621 RepID=A0A238FCX9_9BASI|nr:BQ2448_3799 [Microbotryum intermedium]